MRKNAAFTLLELLVVITIIAILASMAMVAVGLVRQSAQGLRCMSSLRQIALGAGGYALDWDGCIVPTQGYNTVFWHEGLAAYVEESGTASTLASKRVLRGCPTWKTTAYYANNASRTQSATLNYTTGYGETVAPAQLITSTLAGETFSNSLVTGYTIRIEQQLGRVHNPASRPFFSDSHKWFIWASWESIPEDVAAIQRHRGKSNVAFFDGHVAPLTKYDLGLAQLLP